MDRGLWITWYDLPDYDRDAYLTWLHDDYMSTILRRPGVLWGAHYAEVERKIKTADTVPTDDPAVPTGSRYILLFGAECAHVFGNPVPTDLNAALPAASRKMLAIRVGERTNIMAESGRVEGPDAQTYRDGTMLANCIQLGTYNTPWQNEEEMLAYYVQGRLPNMAKLRGCVRTRKLVSVVGWAKHGVLYEFSSLEARNKYFVGHQDGMPKMKAWSDKMIPKLTAAPGSSNLAVRVWPLPTE